MLVTTAEAAELAGVSPATVRKWRYRGLLRLAGRRGRRPLYDPVEVMLVERATRTGEVAHYDDLPVRWGLGRVCPKSGHGRLPVGTPAPAERHSRPVRTSPR